MPSKRAPKRMKTLLPSKPTVFPWNRRRYNHAVVRKGHVSFRARANRRGRGRRNAGEQPRPATELAAIGALVPVQEREGSGPDEQGVERTVRLRKAITTPARTARAG